MEKIEHLWNVNQFIIKLKTPLSAELQTFYMQTCKNLSDEVELPKQNFGPSIMCSHCGSLWKTVDHQIRILRGRKMSKSIQKIVRKSLNESNLKIPKVRENLVKKAIKNEMNTLSIKCSICCKKTKIPFKKGSRPKPIILSNSQIETSKNNRKKKKRKSKDKTAGLNISCNMFDSEINKKHNSETPTKSSLITNNVNANKTLATSAKKQKKLNIERLKHIVSNSATCTKKKSLQNFLAQLI